MEKNCLIHAVDGSIFDSNRAEGIALFIPEGLVDFRSDAEMFVSRFDVKELNPKDMIVRSLPDPNSTGYFGIPAGIVRHLVLIDNLENLVYTVEDMRKQVNNTLDAFAKLGAKTVAMNGIRCRTIPDKRSRPEHYQRRFVEEYLEAHPGVFDAVYLVDLRGGFNK